MFYDPWRRYKGQIQQESCYSANSKEKKINSRFENRFNHIPVRGEESTAREAPLEKRLQNFITASFKKPNSKEFEFNWTKSCT